MQRGGRALLALGRLAARLAAAGIAALGAVALLVVVLLVASPRPSSGPSAGPRPLEREGPGPTLRLGDLPPPPPAARALVVDPADAGGAPALLPGELVRVRAQVVGPPGAGTLLVRRGGRHLATVAWVVSDGPAVLELAVPWGRGRRAGGARRCAAGAAPGRRRPVGRGRRRPRRRRAGPRRALS